MPFGYVIVQYINQKSYYWDFLVHLLIWPQEGPKDEYFGPKWQTRLYTGGIPNQRRLEARHGMVVSVIQSIKKT